jgi:hypothetical protein
MLRLVLLNSFNALEVPISQKRSKHLANIAKPVISVRAWVLQMKPPALKVSIASLIKASLIAALITRQQDARWELTTQTRLRRTLLVAFHATKESIATKKVLRLSLDHAKPDISVKETQKVQGLQFIRQITTGRVLRDTTVLLV